MSRGGSLDQKVVSRVAVRLSDVQRTNVGSVADREPVDRVTSLGLRRVNVAVGSRQGKSACVREATLTGVVFGQRTQT